jgi:peptidoglycan/xylan/chitin deacetylase (PgdA/CDA1 family)
MAFVQKTNLLLNHLSIPSLIRATGQKLFLPFYHTISDCRLAHIENIYPVRSVELFKKDLETLLLYYKPISISELVQLAEGGKQAEESVFHLTFDDGLKELYTVIAPILEALNIPATFFINTAFVDNKALFYRYKVSLLIERIKESELYGTILAKELALENTDFETIKQHLLQLKYSDAQLINTLAILIGVDFDQYLEQEQPYLTTEQLIDLQQRGFCIASHSVDHPFFGDLSEEDKKNQVNQSFAFLNEKFKLTQYYFSFPFSDLGVESSFIDWLYTHSECRLSFGTAGLKADYDKRHLHRVAFDGSLSTAENIIKKQYFNYFIKIFLKRNKFQRN